MLCPWYVYFTTQYGWMKTTRSSGYHKSARAGSKMAHRPVTNLQTFMPYLPRASSRSALHPLSVSAKHQLFRRRRTGCG